MNFENTYQFQFAGFGTYLNHTCCRYRIVMTSSPFRFIVWFLLCSYNIIWSDPVVGFWKIFCCSTFFLSIMNSIQNKSQTRGWGMYCLLLQWSYWNINSRRSEKRIFFLLPFGSYCGGDIVCKLNITRLKGVGL